MTEAARPRAVALGGGHGLYSTLTALRRLTDAITAVVTVADDGGSSGRIRRELGLIPPGDLRQAFAALALAERDGLLDEPGTAGHGPDEHGTRWATVFQHRFGGSGALAGHAVGNLLLAGLFEVLGDPVAALDEAARLLRISGRVLPMCLEPLDIEAEVAGLAAADGTPRWIRGQVAVASTPGQVQRISLRSASGEVPRACPEAVRAVLDADIVLLGPGSWFTSVLPHLLVPELRAALGQTRATKVVVLNLIPQPGETAGFSPERHLDVLCEHAPELRVDAVIADTDAVPTPERLRRAAASMGAHARLAPIAAHGHVGRHDADALAASLREAVHVARS
ncbi:putative cofD-like protein [Tamaricihabitans halophyticus]|uniref:Putative gluconeogenesis factor n=1 Tax=Tamaricihabitans halophyticus TaxID=1262583 RepID=A0A4R2QGQ2_9PSEU|nr:uridine diphosphate-N-acetylglucosamine-binding protein YvcK [Tamaricihabitans halophyticus]TCP46241.1 putative cofD-like protein [Tamaricihabitans halophyticus]